MAGEGLVEFLPKEVELMRFEYYDPASLEEACTFLAENHDRTKIVAGGTDLVVQFKQRALSAAYVLDIASIPDLDFILYDEELGWRLGALTTIRSLETSVELQQACPVISQAAGCLGSVAVRNQATLGGNLCNASPSAEMAPALIALSAQARIRSCESERVVPLEDFFVGPSQTRLKPGEIMTEIQIPPLSPQTRGLYFKHAPRGSIDLAIVGVAAAGAYDPEANHLKELKIALGAVAPRPLRALQAERHLIQTGLDDQLVEAAAQAAADEASPITDVRATEWYRREIIKVLTRKAVRDLRASFH